MDDGQLRQAMRTLDSYNAQLETLNRQVRLLQSSRDEAVRASRSIEALSDAKPGDEVMIPVGASSFVTVKVTEKKTAVVGIGNKISVEKSFDEAQEYLNDAATQVGEALKNAIAAMQEVQQYTEELAVAVQNEYDARKQNASGSK